MRKITFQLVVLTLLSTSALAQSDWQEAYHRRARTERVGMNILGGWAVANMAVSGIAMTQAQGSNRSFHQMTFYWNAVNLGIAGLGFVNTAKTHKRSTSPTLAEAVEAQKSVEKVLLLNTGLDAAYVMSGVWMLEKAKTDPTRQDRLKGFGQAVVAQGGFLLLFDLTNYLIHSRNAPHLRKALDRVSVTDNGIGMVWRW